MAISSPGNQFSLICFFLACFSFPARAETFAGHSESRIYTIPQIEVKAIDIQVPAVLLTQLEAAREKNIAEKKTAVSVSVPARRNLFSGVRLVRSVQPTTMEERMADNTNKGSKDWDKEDQKKPDQKKPDLNQDADQDSENE